MEEWRFTPVRIGLFVALLVAYGLWGGFLPPEVGGMGSPRNVTRAWLLLTVLFVGGSACATMGDQTYGTMDRSSLRFLYLVGGIAAVLISVFWLNSIRGFHVAPEEEASAAPHFPLDSLLPEVGNSDRCLLKWRGEGASNRHGATFV